MKPTYDELVDALAEASQALDDAGHSGVDADCEMCATQHKASEVVKRARE